MDDNVIEIEISDLIKISNGVDEDGKARSAGSLTITKVNGMYEKSEDEIQEKDVKTVKEVTVGGSTINMFVQGGCAVVEIDMPAQFAFEYRNMMEILSKWFKDIDNPEYDDHLLTFSVVPLILGGQITLLFQNIAYYSGIRTDDGYKLIMCFDNTATEYYEIEGIDYRAIQMAIEDELRQEEEIIAQQLIEAENELKKIKEEENPYLQNLKAQYGSDLEIKESDDDDDDGSKENNYMRVVKDDE